MEQTCSATSLGRLMAGALLPNLIGCIPLILITFFAGFNPFIVIALGYMTIGIQSIIYSILMEFFILPNIQTERSVILLSVLLCLTFPLPLLFYSPPPRFLSDSMGYIFFCLLGSFAIIKVSKILYCEYHKQYEQG